MKGGQAHGPCGDRWKGSRCQRHRPGGRFAGNLFGPKDEWAYMEDVTFLEEGQLADLFKGFEIEHFREQHSEGPSVLTPTKLWHLYDVVARKK